MHPISVTSNAIVIVFVHAFPFLIHKSINLRENKFYYYYYYYYNKSKKITLIQIFFSAMQEYKSFSFPIAAISVTIDLTVHSQITVSQSGLFSSTLIRFWPVNNSG